MQLMSLYNQSVQLASACVYVVNADWYRARFRACVARAPSVDPDRARFSNPSSRSLRQKDSQCLCVLTDREVLHKLSFE